MSISPCLGNMTEYYHCGMSISPCLGSMTVFFCCSRMLIGTEVVEVKPDIILNNWGSAQEISFKCDKIK